MTTQQIAARLTELCREGKFEEAQKELYADDAVSIEPMSTPAFAKEVKGLDAILEKGKKFDEMTDTVHGVEISEPVVAPASFAFSLSMDITMKGQERMNMSEICLYEVKNGKIVKESFYM